MNLEIITRDEFNSFKQDVMEALKSVGQSQNKKFLRSAEVRKLLNISAGTLQNLRVNGSIPYSYIGTTIIYDYDEILRVFNENKVN